MQFKNPKANLADNYPSSFTYQIPCQARFVDSGATHHITNSCATLIHYTSTNIHPIKLPNGATTLVIGAGQLHLNFDILLSNILCVHFHLISYLFKNWSKLIIVKSFLTHIVVSFRTVTQ